MGIWVYGHKGRGFNTHVPVEDPEVHLRLERQLEQHHLVLVELVVDTELVRRRTDNSTQ
jgi:hypothetical protein